MGRIALPEHERRDRPVNICFTAVELDLMDSAARKDGKSRSDWARKILLEHLGHQRVIAHQGARFLPKKDLSSLRVSPEVIRSGIVRPPPPPAPRPEGKKPSWWGQLERDAKLCPGRALPA